MYVIIDWHTLYEENPNTYVEQSKEFFEKVSTKYKNSPNIIYEICNEPNGDETTWEEIKKYANTIIPVIRAQSSDALIIVGTPSWSHNVDEVIGNELEYENIMYTCHIYASALTSDRMYRLQTAVNNNIPVFITEWGSSTAKKLGNFFLENSNVIINYIKENNISWCNWNMSDENESVALVKPGEWDNSLNENILSESGKYVKQILQQNIQIDNYPIMMSYKENYAFWANEYRNDITKIIIENTIDSNITSNSVKQWNVSFIESNNNVIAYIENDTENSGKYILHIAGNGGVYCPCDCRNLFSNFTNLKNIELSNLKTLNANDMGFMFANDTNLQELDLSKFQTSNVRYMEKMFYYCSSLKSLDLTSFDTTQLVRMYSMFEGCSNISTINLTNFSTTNVAGLSNIFTNCENLTQINLENFNTKNVRSMSGMFSYCYKLEKITFGTNFNTSNVENMSEMFYCCNSLGNLDLSGFNTSKVTNMYFMFRDCKSINQLNLSNFNTENVNNMQGMFANCFSLKNLNLSNFDTSKITNMSNIFSDLPSIQNLDLSNATFTQVTNYDKMFFNMHNGVIITVKDSIAQAFIQNRISEFNVTANVQIKQ